jgi:hypothetical protein
LWLKVEKVKFTSFVALASTMSLWFDAASFRHSRSL